MVIKKEYAVASTTTYVIRREANKRLAWKTEAVSWWNAYAEYRREEVVQVNGEREQFTEGGEVYGLRGVVVRSKVENDEQSDARMVVDGQMGESWWIQIGHVFQVLVYTPKQRPVPNYDRGELAHRHSSWVRQSNL